MPLHNTPNSYGLVARAFHWLTALVILSALPLGLVANGIDPGPETIAAKARLFSLHKTLGVAAFALGLTRILWALRQPHPVGLHPERKAESLVAHLVHWLLYLSLVLVPLTGWVHHAAVEGFAPILWPFGQGLPFVPKSEAVAATAAALHWVFTKVLAASILLHVAGALKHHLIDRDDTLRRMTRGIAAPARPKAAQRRLAPLGLALAVYAAGLGLALSFPGKPAPAAEAPAVPGEAVAGNWRVEAGNLGFTVLQMGAAVEGSFAGWSAAIIHDETISDGKTGTITAKIDLTSLSLGSVADQARGPDFLDVANHPTARFVADLMAGPDGPVAIGKLSLHGMERPVTLPFTLKISGDSADAQGEVTLDRRDFGIGAGYGDEETVGFSVSVKFALTARRN